MTAALAILFTITATYAYYKLYLRRLSPAARRDGYFRNLYESCHNLDRHITELEELEEFITDVESCNSRLLKNITLSAPSIADGKSNVVNLLVDGKDYNSKQLLALAYSERERRRSLLLDEIEQIYRNGVTKAVTKAMSDSDED